MPRSEWRTILTIGAAVLLPLILFAALLGAFAMRAERQAMEQNASARAREINAEVDGQLWSDRSALEVLTSSQFLIRHDWPKAYERILRIVDDRPRWKNVILTDLTTGREIFETRLPYGDRPGLRPAVADYLKAGRWVEQIDGITESAIETPIISLHVPVFEGDVPLYLLTLEVGPEDFQAILLKHAPQAAVSAIVDRKGRFIARTLDFPNKVGKPATRYVRGAIAGGRQGFYKGVTYEGVRSFTAFQTSDLSGWSTHLAMSASRVAAPVTGARMLIALSGLITLLLAVVLVWFTLRRLADQRQEMEALAQSQKLAAIGQLASGVAHDFNNLLMVITGSLDIIAQQVQAPAVERSLRNAQDAADRGAVLTRQLLDFARAEPAHIETVDLQALMDNIAGLLRQSLGPDIALNVTIDPAARRVRSNIAHLELALINLAVNARDAMPNGGDLTIETRPGRTPGLVDLTVRDTGQGMSKAVMDRALEPFFTTKPAGKGTGLGLAQVFGIVRQSGGTLKLDSVLGQGSTITLSLPAALA